MSRVKIRWGHEGGEAAEERTSEYEFATQAELDAFLKGVDEGCGWLDYEIVEGTVEGE